MNFLISDSFIDGKRTFLRRKNHSIRTHLIRKQLIVDGDPFELDGDTSWEIEHIKRYIKRTIWFVLRVNRPLFKPPPALENEKSLEQLQGSETRRLG